jgi:hypothetical protein
MKISFLSASISVVSVVAFALLIIGKPLPAIPVLMVDLILCAAALGHSLLKNEPNDP